MDISFGYIITFVSLVYGLALTHALSCIAELIQNRSKLQNYWLWWIWAAWFLLLALGFWVSVYSYWHDCVEWSLLKFAFVTLQACLFYFCFYLFFNRAGEINNNLVEGFNKNKRLVFILIGLLFFMMFFMSPLLSDTEREFSANVNITGIVAPVIFCGFAFIKSKWANYVFAFYMLFSFLIQILSGV